MSSSKAKTSREGRNLILTRIIDAPREKVFKPWTDPTLMKQWFAPLPWTTPHVEVDLRPGGSNLVVMRGPDGKEFPNRGVYLEVVKNERLIRTNTCGKLPGILKYCRRLRPEITTNRRRSVSSLERTIRGSTVFPA